MIRLLSCSHDVLDTLKPFWKSIESVRHAIREDGLALTCLVLLANRFDYLAAENYKWKLLFVLAVPWACLRYQKRTVADQNSRRLFRRVFVVQRLDIILTAWAKEQDVNKEWNVIGSVEMTKHIPVNPWKLHPKMYRFSCKNMCLSLNLRRIRLCRSLWM